MITAHVQIIIACLNFGCIFGNLGDPGDLAVWLTCALALIV